MLTRQCLSQEQVVCSAAQQRVRQFQSHGTVISGHREPRHWPPSLTKIFSHQRPEHPFLLCSLIHIEIRQSSAIFKRRDRSSALSLDFVSVPPRIPPLSPMSQADPSCIPIASENVKTCAAQAWTEARPVAESLPKPMRSTFARFFPTDACEAPISAAISELKVRSSICKYVKSFANAVSTKSQSANAVAPPNTSNYKMGGFVFFPGRSLVGQTFTIMIPLHITGNTSVDGLALNMDHFYHIPRKCDIEVSEGAKLVALIIDFD